MDLIDSILAHGRPRPNEDMAADLVHDLLHCIKHGDDAPPPTPQCLACDCDLRNEHHYVFIHATDDIRKYCMVCVHEQHLYDPDVQWCPKEDDPQVRCWYCDPSPCETDDEGCGCETDDEDLAHPCGLDDDTDVDD